jgi:3-deoxy-D-arabino-heptulosonate 7-phosphate (DAHP) synthase
MDRTVTLSDARLFVVIGHFSVDLRVASKAYGKRTQEQSKTQD